MLSSKSMRRLLSFLSGSENEEGSDQVKRRRNGSPYVDPDALFEHAEVQKQLRQLDTSLSKMEGGKFEEEEEKVAG